MVGLVIWIAWILFSMVLVVIGNETGNDAVFITGAVLLVLAFGVVTI